MITSASLTLPIWNGRKAAFAILVLVLAGLIYSIEGSPSDLCLSDAIESKLHLLSKPDLVELVRLYSRAACSSDEQHNQTGTQDITTRINRITASISQFTTGDRMRGASELSDPTLLSSTIIANKKYPNTFHDATSAKLMVNERASVDRKDRGKFAQHPRAVHPRPVGPQDSIASRTLLQSPSGVDVDNATFALLQQALQPLCSAANGCTCFGGSSVLSRPVCGSTWATCDAAGHLIELYARVCEVTSDDSVACVDCDCAVLQHHLYSSLTPLQEFRKLQSFRHSARSDW